MTNYRPPSLLLVFSSPDLSNATLSCARTGVRLFTLRQGTHPYFHRGIGSGPRRQHLPRTVIEDAYGRPVASLECDSNGAPTELDIGARERVPIREVFKPALEWEDLSAPRDKGFQLQASTGGLWHVSRLRIRLLDPTTYAPRAKFYHNHILYAGGRLEPATGVAQGHDLLWINNDQELWAETLVTFILLEHARRIVYRASTYRPPLPSPPQSPAVRPILRTRLSNLSGHLLHLARPRCPQVEEAWVDLDGNELEAIY